MKALAPQPSIADLIRERIECNRELIRHYARFILQLNTMKRETKDIRELVAIAGCIDDCEMVIARATRELTRLSKNRVLKEYGPQRWGNV